MAESAVSLVVDKLLPLLKQEVKLLKGVHDELAGVKEELEAIRAFLKDADSKAEKEGIGDGVKVLVKQIREEAYRIEDVIDDYVLHVARRPDYRCHLLCRIASLIKTCISRHEIASEIKDIKSALLDIKNRRQTFQFISSNQGASSSNSTAGRGCLTFEGIARHLSISNRGSNPPKSSTRSQTRSFMVFDKAMPQKATVQVTFAKFKLLTSLDFEDCPIDHLPNELGNLLHLRYLNLRNTDVEELPRSIGKLHNLESLDLRFSLVEELPVEISDFPKLKHLLAHGGYATGLKIKGSFKHLEFLQTLFTIKVEDDVEILDLESEFSPPIQLQSLWLGGQLDRLPNWISKLHNLSKLILSYSNLMDESVEVLQALPNLKSLVLFWAYNGERMHFGGGGFQKLKYLYLVGLDSLNEMLIDEGALPLLERLEMRSCPMLEEVPSGLQNLRYLEVLSFAWMTEEFNQRWSQQESKIPRHVRIHRSEDTYDPDDKASFEAWMKRKFGAWKRRRMFLLGICTCCTDSGNQSTSEQWRVSPSKKVGEKIWSASVGRKAVDVSV
ncbi:hypothetical protein D5086_009887 [Populus alba]|uniref:Uncharacterized protein n=1 Tax=Populus alba TaxID=43335 RepID=A0ACC4C7T9_POPAL